MQDLFFCLLHGICRLKGLNSSRSTICMIDLSNLAMRDVKK